MKIDVFCEVEKAGITTAGEHQLLKETLAQAQYADACGFDCWWEVEHHTAVEMSYSSAPEVILSAIAQRTGRIRIGHAAVLAPHNFAHPLRIAERAATLDLLSDGRLEVGFARSTIPEWRLFQIPQEVTRHQQEQAMRMVPKMWTEDRFSWESPEFCIRNAPVIPKPYQKPHPPIWQAATSAASFEMAGQLGVGVLGVTLLTPIEAMGGMLASYRQAIKEADPVGSFINNQTGVFTFVHCAETTQQAIDNGAAEAAAWYINTIRKFFELEEMMRQMESAMAEQADVAGAGRFGLMEREASAATATATGPLALVARLAHGEGISGEEVYEVLANEGGVIIGDVETCRRKMKEYREIGTDRLLCFQQVGGLSHESVLDSMRLIGEHIIPEFSPK